MHHMFVSYLSVMRASYGYAVQSLHRIYYSYPQMVGLYKDPTGSRIFRKSGSNMSPAMGLTSMQSSEIDTLKKKVAELQSRLKEKVFYPAIVRPLIYLIDLCFSDELDKNWPFQAFLSWKDKIREWKAW